MNIVLYLIISSFVIFYITKSFLKFIDECDADQRYYENR